MSQKIIEPTTANPQQQLQERFQILSNTAKAPIRQVISQMEEVILSTISQSSQNQVMMEQQITGLNVEIARLQKLCQDNKINFARPAPPVPNRAQRRAADQREAKKKKNNT